MFLPKLDHCQSKKKKQTYYLTGPCIAFLIQNWALRAILKLKKIGRIFLYNYYLLDILVSCTHWNDVPIYFIIFHNIVVHNMSDDLSEL